MHTIDLQQVNVHKNHKVHVHKVHEVSSKVILMSEVSHAIGLKAKMTSRTQILITKQWKSLKSLKKSIPRSQVVRIIDRDDDLKKT